jgi:hypothetical protein
MFRPSGPSSTPCVHFSRPKIRSLTLPAACGNCFQHPPTPRRPAEIAIPEASARCSGSAGAVEAGAPSERPRCSGRAGGCARRDAREQNVLDARGQKRAPPALTPEPWTYNAVNRSVSCCAAGCCAECSTPTIPAGGWRRPSHHGHRSVERRALCPIHSKVKPKNSLKLSARSSDR